ncbi:MAG TPA: histidine phosphatase family protein [Candidatus Acidoferrales bacterium]|nr:histidine phosphatase family protein [Candidatus Acidoferrales bacterium]
MRPAELIIVRHGETVWNTERRFQGHEDSPLTAKGIAQAEALARRLARQAFGALYSSDLGRARKTAEIIAAQTGHAVVPEPRLRERGLGVFQGLTSDEIRTGYPQAYERYRSREPDFVVPGGESLRQQIARNISCLEDLATKHPGETIVVVTHGGVLNVVFRHTLSIPLDAPRRFEFVNGSLNVFAFAQGCWTLRTWGDTAHLIP